MELKLTVEPIPAKQYNLSLARQLPKEIWDKLRRLIYFKNRWTCQICGAFNVRVHCHEVWSYDNRKRIQKLVDLWCLCEDCHLIKHWGRTIRDFHQGKISQEKKDSLVRHFCEVNKCTEMEMIYHIVEMGDTNFKRSKYKYKIDVSKALEILSEAEDMKKRRLG